jgi:hypothetical protein
MLVRSRREDIAAPRLAFDTRVGEADQSFIEGESRFRNESDDAVGVEEIPRCIRPSHAEEILLVHGLLSDMEAEE